MSIETTRATLLYRTNARIKTAVGYRTVLWQKLNAGIGSASDPSAREREAEINRLLSGYPRNHDYRIVRKRLIPSFRLYARARLVEQLYPQPLESFLDIGCCRGFYVLDAARRPTCKTSVGIDVHEPFTSTAETVRQYLEVPNAAIHFASLQDVADDPARFGGPFQTVLLVGTYHYLFWGSGLCPTAYYSHREILQRIAHICTDRCLFSARLEIDRLPPDVRQIAESHPEKAQYTTDGFLQSAGEFFNVSAHGFLGTYALFMLSRRSRS